MQTHRLVFRDVQATQLQREHVHEILEWLNHGLPTDLHCCIAPEAGVAVPWGRLGVPALPSNSPDPVNWPVAQEGSWFMQALDGTLLIVTDATYQLMFRPRFTLAGNARSLRQYRMPQRPDEEDDAFIMPPTPPRAPRSRRIELMEE